MSSTSQTSCAKSEQVQCEAFSKSAVIYDLIHAGKDYDGEAKRVLELLGPPAGKLIDWGAGTGEFTRRFISAGWSAVGADISTKMIDAMFRKGIPFRDQSMSHLFMGDEGKYHAQTCLFAAFSYASAAHPPLLILENFRKAAAAGGKLVVDFINADAELRPFQKRELPFIRVQQSKRLVDSRLIENKVSYDVRGEQWTELHYMRTFTRREIAELIARAGWKLEQIVDLSYAPPLARYENYYLHAVCTAI